MAAHWTDAANRGKRMELEFFEDVMDGERVTAAHEYMYGYFWNFNVPLKMRKRSATTVYADAVHNAVGHAIVVEVKTGKVSARAALKQALRYAYALIKNDQTIKTVTITSINLDRDEVVALDYTAEELISVFLAAYPKDHDSDRVRILILKRLMGSTFDYDSIANPQIIKAWLKKAHRLDVSASQVRQALKFMGFTLNNDEIDLREYGKRSLWVRGSLRMSLATARSILIKFIEDEKVKL